MKFDGLIFDMDGVIVDVSKSYREAIRLTAGYFLRREVMETEVSEIKNRIGMNNDWEATYALINDKSVSFNKMKTYFQTLYLGDSKKKGLITKEKLLISKAQFRKLKAKFKKLGIATGRPRDEANYVISLNRLENIFDSLVTMKDVKRGKPFPDSLNKVIEDLKLENTVYIGDSPSDVLAAEKAEIPSIYIGEQKIGTTRFINVCEMMEYLL